MGKDGRCSTICGTLEYKAPEVIHGHRHGKEVDWWALGVVLYEMVVGIPPFYSRDEEVMRTNILHRDLRFSSRVASKPTRALIANLLQRDPERRLG